MAETGQEEPTQARSPGPPGRPEVLSRGRNLLGYLVVFGGLLMLADLYLTFMVAPTEAVMGDVQRVMYFHVPLAVMSYVAFFLVFVASIAYLVKRTAKWDRLAQASAEVGVVFVTLALITGIIWSKPVWYVPGQWWVWEPKLATTLILWLIYVTYLMVRGYAPNKSKGAIYAAVVGIVGFVDVPIVYKAADWWRGTHPPTDVSLTGTMYGVLGFSFITFFVLFLYLVLQRMALGEAEDELGEMRSAARRRADILV